MNWRWRYVLLIFLMGCNTKYARDRIEEPVLTGSINKGVLAAIDEQLEEKPNDPQLLKRKVRFLESANWPEGSVETLTNVIEEWPEDGELHFIQARYFLHHDRLDSALISLQRAGQVGYLTAEYFSVYAQTLLSDGDIEHATLQARRFFELDPRNHRSQMLLGKIHFEATDTASAKAAYLQAFNLEKGDDELNLLLLDLMLQVEDTAGFNRVIGQIDQSDERWLLKQAMLKYSHGLLADATTDLKGILALNEGSMPAMLYLGRFFFEMSRYDSSLYYADRALISDSLSLVARLQKARTYDKMYAYGQAIDEYQSLLVIDSAYDNAAEELNNLYRKVAYLRRLREEKESIPQIDLAPIRRKNLE